MLYSDNVIFQLESLYVALVLLVLYISTSCPMLWTQGSVK